MALYIHIYIYIYIYIQSATGALITAPSGKRTGLASRRAGFVDRRIFIHLVLFVFLFAFLCREPRGTGASTFADLRNPLGAWSLGFWRQRGLRSLICERDVPARRSIARLGYGPFPVFPGLSRSLRAFPGLFRPFRAFPGLSGPLQAFPGLSRPFRVFPGLSMPFRGIAGMMRVCF